MSTRYDTFYDDLSPGTDGFEITVPVGITYTHEHFSLGVLTAYSDATVNFDEDDSSSGLSSVTDTLVSASYTLTIPRTRIALIAGVDANFPTGKERLSEQEERVEAGEDHNLFLVEDFGEGLNIGLSLGLGRESEKLSIGLHSAYIFKGEFDPTRDIPDDDLDQGDQATAIALVNWKAASWLSLETFTSYTYFFPDKTNGEEHFREGALMSVGENFRIGREPVELALSVQSSFQQKNEELVNDHLEREPENSNGIKVSGSVEITYTMFSNFALRMQGNIRYYLESDRKDDLSGLPFSGERIRYAGGPGFRYVLNRHLSCSGWATYFLMDQDRDLSLDQDVTFQGVNVELGVQVIL